MPQAMAPQMLQTSMLRDITNTDVRGTGVTTGTDPARIGAINPVHIDAATTDPAQIGGTADTRIDSTEAISATDASTISTIDATTIRGIVGHHFFENLQQVLNILSV